jgi:hypothetical protein
MSFQYIGESVNDLRCIRDGNDVSDKLPMFILKMTINPLIALREKNSDINYRGSYLADIGTTVFKMTKLLVFLTLVFTKTTCFCLPLPGHAEA